MRVAAALAAVTVMGGAAACGIPGAVGYPKETPVEQATETLAGFQTPLRDQVDALIGDLALREPPVTVEDDGTCADVGHWPRQRNYNVHLLVAGTEDARPAARAMMASLRADGWTIRDTTSAEQVDFNAQRDGFGLNITGGSTEGAMVIDAGSPCVSADGEVERRYVP